MGDQVEELKARIEKLEAELALAYDQIRFLRKAVKYV